MNLPFKAAVMAERNRNRVYEEVIRVIEEAAAREGVTKGEIAQRLGKPASQISRLLSGPSNWTLDTVSHLLFAVDAEMDYNAVFHKDRRPQKVTNITSESNGPYLITTPSAQSGSASPIIEIKAQYG